MEMEKVPAAGYKIEGLWISGLQRKLWSPKNLSFPFKVMSSVRRSKKILKRFKPDVAVGVGGYASGPLLYAAAKKKVPTLIQEQNSYPGITNKLLAKRANRICVAYDNMERWFPKEKIIRTGNPVRDEVVKLEGKKARAQEHFGLDANRKTILVIGGSLGALTINESIQAGLERFREANVQVIWQTGKSYINRAEEALGAFDYDGVKAHAFITKMDFAYAAADVVISRAGAMSISELCLVKKPSILVPSPNVAEDHQTKNAMALVNHQAAILVRDVEARDKLVSAALPLITNENECKQLEGNIAGLAFENSVDAIAAEVVSLARKQT